MRKAWNTLLAMGSPLLVAVIGILLILSLFLYRINSLVPGVSQPELDTHSSTRSLTQVFETGTNLPYNTSVFVLTKIANNTVGLRLTGVIMGILTVLIFYLLVRNLYSTKTVYITSAMFVTSTLLLSVSRLATPNVMLLSLLMVVAAGYILRFNKNQEIAWILAVTIIGLSLYVPGILFFIIIASIWQLSRIQKSFENLKPAIIITCSVILSILIAPFVINLFLNPELWRQYLGIPAQLASIQEMISQTIRATASIFLITPASPVYWLGRLPILNAFESALFLFGLFSISKQNKLDRFWALIGIFILVIIFAGFTGNVLFIVALLPFLYIVIGFGIDETLNRWYEKFPKNPIARTVGLSLLSIAVILSFNYQLQRYFIAWPNSVETINEFNLQIPN